MSYHNARNIEQYSSMEGQATAYGSSSDASMNEVMTELSKRHNHLAKHGGTGDQDSDSATATQDGIPKGCPMVGELKGFAAGGGLKDFAAGGGSDSEFAQYHKKGIAGENAIIDKKYADLAFGESLASGKLNYMELKNAEGHASVGGTGFAERANSSNSWDRTLNNAMLGIGVALGPMGLPLVMTAEARMIQDRLSAKSYADAGSGGLHKELMQRQKMLKSWTLRDE